MDKILYDKIFLETLKKFVIHVTYSHKWNLDWTGMLARGPMNIPIHPIWEKMVEIS
jgi:hypothetical protein